MSKYMVSYLNSICDNIFTFFFFSDINKGLRKQRKADSQVDHAAQGSV